MVLVRSVVGEFAPVVQSEGFLLEGIGIDEWGSWKGHIHSTSMETNKGEYNGLFEFNRLEEVPKPPLMKQLKQSLR